MCKLTNCRLIYAKRRVEGIEMRWFSPQSPSHSEAPATNLISSDTNVQLSLPSHTRFNTLWVLRFLLHFPLYLYIFYIPKPFPPYMLITLKKCPSLLYLRWITNKVLLYSTGNSAHCCDSLGGRRVWGRMDTHIQYGWASWLFTLNCHNIVNRLYFNRKQKAKMVKKIFFTREVSLTYPLCAYCGHWKNHWNNLLYYHCF